MSDLHWWFIGASWTATLLAFGGLAGFALWRHRNAKRALARLETRARTAGGAS